MSTERRWEPAKSRTPGRWAKPAPRLPAREQAARLARHGSVAVDHHAHPRWGNRRQADAAWELLAAGRLRCEEIVQPVVTFENAAEAYREYVDEHPERSVKLGVMFD